MDLANAHDLLWLAEDHGDTRLSLFLPLRPGAAGAGRTRIRAKTLLRQAGQALRSDGRRPAVVDLVIDAAGRALDDMRLFERRSVGLALYVGPERGRAFPLPMPDAPLSVVGNRFAVGPLLPMLTLAATFSSSH